MTRFQQLVQMLEQSDLEARSFGGLVGDRTETRYSDDRREWVVTYDRDGHAESVQKAGSMRVHCAALAGA